MQRGDALMQPERSGLSFRLRRVRNRCQRFQMVAKSEVALRQLARLQKRQHFGNDLMHGSGCVPSWPAHNEQRDPRVVDVLGVKLYYRSITIKPMAWRISSRR